MKHIKTDTEDYYIDDQDRRQGEFKSYYHRSGELLRHGFYVDNEYHGEYKLYRNNGKLYVHRFYLGDTDVTKEVELVVSDISNITSEEKVMLKLQLGLDL